MRTGGVDVTEADVKGVLKYLRNSAKFQPSDSWRKALDRAMSHMGFN